MNSPDATVILKSPGGSWTAIGTEDARGIVPEGISLSSNESGPDTCSFSLKREASAPWPDLLAFNQCDVFIGGTLLWSGRIWEAPLSDADEDVIAVQGRGWQYHLDDDLRQAFYVLSDMSRYVDQRSKPAADLSVHFAGTQVQVGSGVITLNFPRNFTLAGGDRATVTVDLGAALAKRAVVTWVRTGGIGTDAGTTIYSRGSTAENAVTAGDDASSDLTSASGTLTHTFAAARRYHHLILFRNGGAGTLAADEGVQITSVKLFGETTYESGGVSVLKASQVVSQVLGSGALPLLDSSTANIATTAFSIPELAPSGYQTPRALIAAANAFEGKLVGVDAERRVFLKTRGTSPEIEVGAWPGSSFQDSSTNSGEGLYNRVIVQGTGPDGSPVAEVRTAASSLLTRQGFTRTAVLSVDAAITTTGADQLGDIWLSERANPPLKGSLAVSGWGGARHIYGGDVHPSELMLRYGQKIRLGQLVDPSTGDQGRDGIVKSVSYAHDTETASLEMDSERGRLETLLSRLAVVTSQIR
ncbi:MAG: hypothetical protein H0W82_00055 [Actinobacteria bacterium]|nr:hypothetical protein [Actinomycetota bacterium]